MEEADDQNSEELIYALEQLIVEFGEANALGTIKNNLRRLSQMSLTDKQIERVARLESIVASK